MTDVVVCDFGAGNTRSVLAAFDRLGEAAATSDDPEVICEAPFVVLPGVGSARSAMSSLSSKGLDEALRERVSASRPVLGICLGLQLAMEWSAEDGGVACLGLCEGTAAALVAPRVPRLGWASVDPWGGTYYFAHAFAVSTPSAVAWSEGLVAAAATGSYLGVQFHPERSGPAGRAFLQRCRTRD